MTNPASYRPLLAYIGGLESGYHPPKGGDPETIFGITVDNWPAALRSMSAATRSRFSPIMQKYVDTILSTDGAEQDAATRQMMRYIGRELVPQGGGTQPASGMPKQSTMQPSRNADAWQLRDIETLYTAAQEGLLQNYVIKAGFVFDSPKINENYPRDLIPYLVDMSINAGPACTHAALAYAMTKAGLGSTRMPLVTPQEALQDNFFTTNPRGKPYVSREMDQILVSRLQSASPAQLERVIENLQAWRTELNNNIPGVGDALNTRQANLDNWARKNWRGQQSDATTALDSLVTVSTQPADAPSALDNLVTRVSYGSADNTPPIKVQYVVNFGTAAVSLEIPPGYAMPPGIYQYDLDPETHRIKGKPTRMPPGVRYFAEGTVGIEVDGREIMHNYPPNTFVWTDEKGEYHAFQPPPELNLKIAQYGTPKILGSYMSLYAARLFEYSEDGQHLVGKNNDLLFVSGEGFELRDMRTGQKTVIPPDTTTAPLIASFVASSPAPGGSDRSTRVASIGR